MGAAEVLPPGQARAGGVLDLLDLRPAHLLVLGQRSVEVVWLAGHGRREGDSVLHCHLGAGANREVSGVCGVAEQGDRRAADAVPPPLSPARLEVAPAGVIHQQRVAVDLPGEQLLQVVVALTVAAAGRLVYVELIKAGGGPGGLVGLDDESGDAVADRVTVHGEHAVRTAFVDERQPLERVAGAEPDELRSGGLDTGPERVPVTLPEPGICPIGRDDQVISRAEDCIDVRLRGEPDVHSFVRGLPLQQGKQHFALDRSHPVAAAAVALAVQAHLDGIPLHPVLGQRGPQHGIGRVDAGQVASENTTPNPNVSATRLRSNTVTS